jgi:membrane protein DedA with SNARE-associated domain
MDPGLDGRVTWRSSKGRPPRRPRLPRAAPRIVIGMEPIRQADDAPAVNERPLLEPGDPDAERDPSHRRVLPTPWDGPMQTPDRVIVAGIAISGLYGLVLLPLFPLLGSSHPALVELLRGSTAAIVNMGARASVGQTSFALAVLLGVPSVMMFDWVFWWAGRRWGDRVFVWLLGRDDAKAQRRLTRMRALERRFGPLAVVLAPVLPIPSVLIYAAVGDGGMRLATFLVLDLAGALLWTGLLATLGYELGQSAVDVTDAITHYALWATLALVAAVIAVQAVRAQAAQRPGR